MWVLILVILSIAFVFFAVPSVIFFILWVKSFDRKALIFKKIGDENNTRFTIVKCKLQNDKFLGHIIRFFPLSSHKLCNQYDSKFWRDILINKKAYPSIMLLNDGVDYKPISFEKGSFLVSDSNNKEFILFSAQHSTNKQFTESKFYTIIVVSSLVFFLFFGIVCIIALFYLLNMNMEAYISLLMTHGGGVANG